jgi:soluble lytic murein transglycosylase
MTTYYGQLAWAKLGPDAPARLFPEPKPKPEERAAFEAKELVRVVRALIDIGEGDRAKPFLLRLSELAKTPPEHAMIAALATSLGRVDFGVSVAKKASYAGVTLLVHGYPVIDLPKEGSTERPLVLAVTRQESAFDHEAVSRAGARGLMQLMPATASQTARAVQVPYSLSRLTSDPKYNLTLGRAYLGGLVDSFSGSYVLSIAAYNAGPARVRQWIRDFGDPRDPNVDVVDWVEAIPYSETRNYVQRVLENLQVYRLRLGDHTQAFNLASDLKRSATLSASR